MFAPSCLNCEQYFHQQPSTCPCGCHYNLYLPTELPMCHCIKPCKGECVCACHLTVGSDPTPVPVVPKPPKFWMVKGTGATTVTYNTYEKARTEADRLARNNPFQGFYILETTQHIKVQVVPVMVTDL